MDAIDAEVLATLQDDILRLSVIEHALALIQEALAPAREDDRRAQLATELAALDVEVEELTAGLARGGDAQTMVTLIERLQDVQTRRATLTASRSAKRPIVAPAPPLELEERLRAKIADRRGLLTRNVESGGRCSARCSRARSGSHQ
jgi:hypothetical protein